MSANFLKHFLPDRPVPTRIWRGPFRGARVTMKPRDSLRKILGIYEHELNGWIEAALHRSDRVVDVGANDGYFTFGCAAAFRRLGKPGEIIAFEPQERHVAKLRESVNEQRPGATEITLVASLVGAREGAGMTTLDALRWKTGDPEARSGTLLKIDVEGAEMDVLAGADSWLNPGNCFVIEVHQRAFLEQVQKLFQTKGMKLKQVNQKPLALFGREERGEENWWLVSDLGQP
ncbi:MAG TPA: FkbM family methyltransferase [Verrucomicrobiae bacterium]|jgi:hypothetical protein